MGKLLCWVFVTWGIMKWIVLILVLFVALQGRAQQNLNRTMLIGAWEENVVDSINRYPVIWDFLKRKYIRWNYFEGDTSSITSNSGTDP